MIVRSFLIPIAALFLIFRIYGNAHKNLEPVGQSPGSLLYSKYCLSCHQEDGTGVHGTFPPLAGNIRITGPSKDIVRIVLFGLQGPLVVNERDYDQVMPPQNYLTDQQIADILTYIRNAWGNKAVPVTPGEVAGVRKLGK